MSLLRPNDIRETKQTFVAADINVCNADKATLTNSSLMAVSVRAKNEGTASHLRESAPLFY